MPEQQFKEFLQITKDMYELHVKKNNDYGTDNIGALGEKGIYVRIWDKVSRLKELVWESKEQKVKDESINDTLTDLAIYSIIMLIYRSGKWGKWFMKKEHKIIIIDLSRPGIAEECQGLIRLLNEGFNILHQATMNNSMMYILKK